MAGLTSRGSAWRLGCQGHRSCGGASRPHYGLPMLVTSIGWVCMLVQNRNVGSKLGLDNSPSHHNRDVGDLMIVNASDINSLIRLLNNANIITSNASIDSSINK